MSFIKAVVLLSLVVLDVTRGYHVNIDDVGIHGGESVQLKEAAFMVSIRAGTKLKCGGTVIDEQFILTSAHCVPQRNPNEYTIHARTQTIKKEGDVYMIDKIIKHEDFNATHGYDYDIALLKLSKKINLKDSNVESIDLPSSKLKLPENSDLTIYGWGETEQESFSNSLQTASVPLLAISKCKETYGNNLTPRMICTKDTKKGFCNGDSGGPALYSRIQIGISAFSWNPCTRFPQVYTYLPPLRSWIDEKIRENR